MCACVFFCLGPAHRLIELFWENKIKMKLMVDGLRVLLDEQRQAFEKLVESV